MSNLGRPRSGVTDLCVLVVLLCLVSVRGPADDNTPTAGSSPGQTHAGQPFPDYVTGDECLFCHRREIAATWPQNHHQRSMRPATSEEPAVIWLKQQSKSPRTVADVRWLVGGGTATRFLRKSAAWGQADLLNWVYRDTAAATHPGRADPLPAEPTWDSSRFAARCAGCHATAVETESGAFAAESLDCVVCHGVADLTHSSNPQRMWLSQQNRPARQVISICGQCHLRGGRSRQTGRPYPDTFVPGDDLFADYQIELSRQLIQQLPVRQRHIYENTADVLAGTTQHSCLACHNVHDQTTTKHTTLTAQSICGSCHQQPAEEGRLLPSLQTNPLVKHNSVCEY